MIFDDGDADKPRQTQFVNRKGLCHDSGGKQEHRLSKGKNRRTIRFRGDPAACCFFCTCWHVSLAASLGLYHILSVGMRRLFFWAKRKDSALLKERISRQKDVKPWDRKIIAVYTFFLAALPVVAGLDAARFRRSKLTLGVNLVGFAGFGLAMLGIFWAAKENTYLSSVVRIQSDRGQSVCTTGPYACIRHPMYAAIILLVICLPLALGSLYALVPAVIIVGLIILRTSLEDKTLQRELAGYTEYAKTVRFRLLPGMW